MRAFFVEHLAAGMSTIEVTGEDVHHFVHVLRGKIGEDVLVLNGVGGCAKGQVQDIKKKKSITLAINSFETKKRSIHKELALGITKKEYLVDILRMATEVGVAKIHLIIMDKTPWKYSWSDRYDKVIKSAVTQSNNFFKPEIVEHKCLKSFLDSCENEVFALFTESSSGKSEKEPLPQTVLIGPEGGFSSEEIDLLKSYEKVTLKRLPNPIMKSVTASIFALGYISD